MRHPQITYLALGDSYTVGEAVPAAESYPYQTVAMLRGIGLAIADPDIIAVTGWTTDELHAAILDRQPLKQYDLVTLLIGVNNQYRGRSVENYKLEFKGLLEIAIGLAGGKKEQVVVLTIPNYGETPFAKNSDPKRIAREIAAFNAAAVEICAAFDVAVLDISAGFQKAKKDVTLIAADGLHPSGKAYQAWAEQLSALLQQRFK